MEAIRTQHPRGVASHHIVSPWGQVTFMQYFYAMETQPPMECENSNRVNLRELFHCLCGDKNVVSERRKTHLCSCDIDTYAWLRKSSHRLYGKKTSHRQSPKTVTGGAPSTNTVHSTATALTDYVWARFDTNPVCDSFCPRARSVARMLCGSGSSICHQE